MITSYRGRDVTGELQSFLAEHALTPADFAVLTVLWGNSLPPARLIRAAMKGSAARSPHDAINEWRITRGQAEAAVVGLVDRRFLHVIDSNRQSRIASRLAADTKLYFQDVLPNIGDVDVTPNGVRTLMRMYRSVFEWTDATNCIVYSYPDDQTVRALATSEEYFRQGLSTLSVDHDGQSPCVKAITKINGWRDRWWRPRRGGISAELEWTLG